VDGLPVGVLARGAWERLLAKALGGENHPAPRVINTDEHAGYPPAIVRLKAEEALKESWSLFSLSYSSRKTRAALSEPGRTSEGDTEDNKVLSTHGVETHVRAYIRRPLSLRVSELANRQQTCTEEDSVIP
jgi:hypothetical protein